MVTDLTHCTRNAMCSAKAMVTHSLAAARVTETLLFRARHFSLQHDATGSKHRHNEKDEAASEPW